MLMWSNEFEPPTFHLLTLYLNMGKCSRKKDPPYFNVCYFLFATHCLPD